MLSVLCNLRKQGHDPSPKRSRIRAGVLGSGVVMTVAATGLGVSLAGAASASPSPDNLNQGQAHDVQQAGATRTTGIQGNGSNDDPYVLPCDNPGQEDCVVSWFPDRTLKGLANEYVPAYKCPTDHPYLLDQRFVDNGKAIPFGVEISEDGGGNRYWSIDVSITGNSLLDGPGGHERYSSGTLTGFPNSSATNWTTDDHRYQVILHCTSNVNHADPVD